MYSLYYYILAELHDLLSVGMADTVKNIVLVLVTVVASLTCTGTTIAYYVHHSVYINLPSSSIDTVPLATDGISL